MADTRQLKVQILGDAKGAIKAFSDVEKSGNGIGKSLAIAGASIAAAGGAAVAFGVKAANKFAEVGGQVKTLQRLTGGTAEEMSKLRFAAQRSGLDTDALGKSLGILSKHLSSNDAAAKKLGITFRDTKGKALPLNDTLLKIAEKFKSMPDGIDKNALALQLFGKAGTQLIPFLNKGKDGLAALEDQAKKFGVVLTGDHLEAIRKNVEAHRNFASAMEGLQIQIGQYVLPVLTAVTSFLADHLGPVITTVGGIARDYLAPAFDFAIKVLENVAERAVTAFRRLWDWIGNRIVPVIRDVLVPILRDKLAPVAHRVGDLFGSHLPATFGKSKKSMEDMAVVVGSVGGAFASLIPAIALIPNPILLVAAAIAAIGAAFVVAYQKIAPLHELVDRISGAVRVMFNEIRGSGLRDLVAGFTGSFDQIDENYGLFKLGAMFQGLRPPIEAFIGFMQGTVAPAVQAAAEAITEQFNHLVMWFQTIWPQISEAVTHVMNVIAYITAGVLAEAQVLWHLFGDDVISFVTRTFAAIGDVINAALDAIRGLIQLVLALINGDWGQAWESLKQIARAAWDAIFAVVAGSVGTIRSLLGAVASVITELGHTMWAGLGAGFKAALNTVIRSWNGLDFKVPKVDIGPVHFGGQTIGTPNIPLLAAGGIVTRPTLAMLGEAGDEAVIPLSRMPMMGAPVVINIGTVDSDARVRQLADAVMAAVTRKLRRDGRDTLTTTR